MMKVALVFLPIFIIRVVRYRPRFVRIMLRATIAAYVGIYVVLFVMINLGFSGNTVHLARRINFYRESGKSEIAKKESTREYGAQYELPAYPFRVFVIRAFAIKSFHRVMNGVGFSSLSSLYVAVILEPPPDLSSASSSKPPGAATHASLLGGEEHLLSRHQHALDRYVGLLSESLAAAVSTTAATRAAVGTRMAGGCGCDRGQHHQHSMRVTLGCRGCSARRLPRSAASRWPSATSSTAIRFRPVST